MKNMLVIIAAGDLQVPAIKRAKKMGFDVIAIDINPLAPGFQYADYKICKSSRDFKGAINELKPFKQNLRGVLTLATDASITVAEIAHYFNLPGISPEIARISTNKYLTRKHLSDSGMPTPAFRLVNNFFEAKNIIKDFNLPVVIKPVDNMGSRGITKISSTNNLEYSFKRALQFSLSQQVIIEEYMEGPEYSIDAYMHNDNLFILGLADRIITFAPYFVETGYNMPSELNKAERDNLFKCLKQGSQALGVKDGIIKGDLKITPQGPRIIELAVRLSGNRMSTDAIPLSNGLDPVKVAIELALGKTPETEKSLLKTKAFAYRSFIPSPGILKDIQGLKSAKKTEGLIDLSIKIKHGDRIPLYKCSADSIGYVMSIGDTLKDAIGKAEKARDRVKFIVE